MILHRESYVDIVSLQTTVPSEQLVALQRAERSNYTTERTVGLTLTSIKPSRSVIKPHRASLNTLLTFC